MADLLDLDGHIRVSARSAPRQLILDSIRDATIELCERGYIYTHDQDALSSIALEGIYPFDLPAETKVVTIKQGWYDGKILVGRSGDQLLAAYSGANWKAVKGTPQYVTMENKDEFRLVPFPEKEITNAIVLVLYLKISQDATTAPDWILEEYKEAIQSGALSRILTSNPKDPWYDAKSAEREGKNFTKLLAGVRAKATAGFTRSPQRASSPFRFA